MLRERANPGLHDFLYQLVVGKGWLPAGGSLLDAGCGTGAWLSRFADAPHQARLTGVDANTTQTDVPEARVIPCILDAYQGEVWGAFHLITAIEVIEHLEYPGLLWRLIAANLQPEGIALITTPNIHALPARLKFLWCGRLSHFDHKSDGAHIYPVYLESIHRVLPRYGLELAQIMSWPPKGYPTFAKPLRLASWLLSALRTDRLPGDNLILVVRKNPTDIINR